MDIFYLEDWKWNIFSTRLLIILLTICALKFYKKKKMFRFIGCLFPIIIETYLLCTTISDVIKNDNYTFREFN